MYCSASFPWQSLIYALPDGGVSASLGVGCGWVGVCGGVKWTIEASRLALGSAWLRMARVCGCASTVSFALSRLSFRAVRAAAVLHIDSTLHFERTRPCSKHAYMRPAMGRRKTNDMHVFRTRHKTAKKSSMTARARRTNTQIIKRQCVVCLAAGLRARDAQVMPVLGCSANNGACGTFPPEIARRDEKHGAYTPMAVFSAALCPIIIAMQCRAIRFARSCGASAT